MHLERALARCSSLEERQIPLSRLLIGAIGSVDRCDQVLVLVDASLVRNLMVVVRHEGACTCNSRLSVHELALHFSRTSGGGRAGTNGGRSSCQSQRIGSNVLQISREVVSDCKERRNVAETYAFLDEICYSTHI